MDRSEPGSRNSASDSEDHHTTGRGTIHRVRGTVARTPGSVNCNSVTVTTPNSWSGFRRRPRIPHEKCTYRRMVLAFSTQVRDNNTGSPAPHMDPPDGLWPKEADRRAPQAEGVSRSPSPVGRGSLAVPPASRLFETRARRRSRLHRAMCHGFTRLGSFSARGWIY